MRQMTFTVRFVTPAFLGGADQSAQWRTPPFKALIRQWWRVAEAAGRKPETGELHRREGELFGRAADEGTTASQVKLRLDWRGGKVTRDAWNAQQADRFANVSHPEVKDRNDTTKLQPVGTALYLGYGPVDVGNRLKRESALAPDQFRSLELGVPASAEERFQDVLRLAHAFGALGSRSRNGWGSLHFEQGGLTAEELEAMLDSVNRAGRDWLRPFSRDWRKALDTDWCHAVGRDERGLLLWRTEKMSKWEDVLKTLAEAKIAFRTQFHFNGGGPHNTLCDRQLLAYPITRHALNGQGWERNANQVLFKVLPHDGKFVGLIAHLPHELPARLRRGTGLDEPSLSLREKDIWQKVHEMLDNHSGVLSRVHEKILAQTASALKLITRLP